MTADTAGGTTEALRSLRREVRELIDAWRADGLFVPRCDNWLRGSDREFTAALAERGWIGMTWPKDLGGGDRSNTARLVVTEELLVAGAPVAAHWIADRQIGPAILRYGTRQLQEEFLPSIAAGRATFCLGMSETEAGSDLAAVRTNARRDDGGWRITGRKIWTSHAHGAEYAYVLARTDRTEQKHEGLTEFIVELAAPGVEISPILDLQGEHHFNEVVLDDVPVPDRWVIGEVGNGWNQVTEQLAFERGGPERMLSTYPLLAAAIDRTGNAAVDRFVRILLGELVARLHALRRLAYEVARTMDRGEAPVQMAALLKDQGTAFEQDVVEVARRVLDGEADPGGETVTGLLAGGVLAAPGVTIRGGTTEILRTIVARSVTTT